MPEDLEFTGERFTPECVREIWYEHLHRYALAARWCAGRTVLDAACGEGYGAALLAGAAELVTGIDRSADAIEHARRRYGHHGNLAFEVGDCTRLPYPDGQFQCIVSFETLEHVADQAGMLAEFRRVLDPDGFLLLSSPDKAVYTEQLGNRNPHHVRELYREELLDLVARQFPHHRLLGQRLLFHSVIWSQEGGGRVAVQTLGNEKLTAGGTVAHAPVYYIVQCAFREDCLPVLENDLWLFDDSSQSVYEHYLGEIRKNMAAGGIIAERDREIEELKRRLGQEGKPRTWLWRLLRRG